MSDERLRPSGTNYVGRLSPEGEERYKHIFGKDVGFTTALPNLADADRSAFTSRHLHAADIFWNSHLMIGGKLSGPTLTSARVAAEVTAHIIRNTIRDTRPGLVQITPDTAYADRRWEAVRNTLNVFEADSTRADRLETAMTFYPDLVQAFVVCPQTPEEQRFASQGYANHDDIAIQSNLLNEIQNRRRDFEAIGYVLQSPSVDDNPLKRDVMQQWASTDGWDDTDEWYKMKRDEYGQSSRSFIGSLSLIQLGILWETSPEFVVGAVKFASERNDRQFPRRT